MAERIVESPRVGQWLIEREEVPASAVEAPPHRLSGHVMSTGPNAFRDSGQCKIDGRQPEVDDVHAVTALLQPSESPNERVACERGFEGEALSLRLEGVEPRQRDPARLKGNVLWAECR